MSKKLTRFVLATLLGLVSTLIPQSAQAAYDLPKDLDGWKAVINWDAAEIVNKLSSSENNISLSGDYVTVKKIGDWGSSNFTISTDQLTAGKKYRFGMYYGGKCAYNDFRYNYSSINFQCDGAYTSWPTPLNEGYSAAFTAKAGVSLQITFEYTGNPASIGRIVFYEEPEPYYSWGPYDSKDAATAAGWVFGGKYSNGWSYNSSYNGVMSMSSDNYAYSPEITLPKGNYSVTWEDATYDPNSIAWNGVDLTKSGSGYSLSISSTTTSKFYIVSSSATILNSLKIFKLPDPIAAELVNVSWDPMNVIEGESFTVSGAFKVSGANVSAYTIELYKGDDFIDSATGSNVAVGEEATFSFTEDPTETATYGVRFMVDGKELANTEQEITVQPTPYISVSANVNQITPLKGDGSVAGEPVDYFPIGKISKVPVTITADKPVTFNNAYVQVKQGGSSVGPQTNIDNQTLEVGQSITVDVTVNSISKGTYEDGQSYDFVFVVDGSSETNKATRQYSIETVETMPDYVDLRLESSNIPATYTIKNNGAPYKVDYSFLNNGKTAEGAIKLFVNDQVVKSVDQNFVWKEAVTGSIEYNFTEVGKYNVKVVAEAEDNFVATESVEVTVGADYSLIVTPEIPFNQIAGETMNVPVIVQNDGPITANYRIMIYTQDTAFDQSAIPYDPIMSLNRQPIRHLAPGKSIRIDDLESFTSSTPGDKYVAVVYRFYEGNEENDWNIQKDMFMAPAEAKRVKFAQGKPNVAVSYTIAEGKTAYVEGETISVTATLANSGNVAGTVGEAILYGVKDGGRPVELAKATPSAGIAPEASATVELTTAPLTAEQAGEWEVFVQYKTGYYSNNFTFDSAHQTVTVRAHEYGVEMVNAEGAEEIVAGNPLIVEVTLKNHLDAFEGFRLTAVSEIDAIESVEDATVSLGVDEEKTYTLKINFKKDADPIQLFSYVLYNGENVVMEAKGGVNILIPEAPEYAIDEESFAINYPEELTEGTANFKVTVSFKNTGREIEGFNLKVVGSDVAESTVEAVELATDAEGEYTVTVTLAEELSDPMRFEGSLVLINEENTTLFEIPMYINIKPEVVVEEGYEVTIDEERTVLVPAGVEKLQAGIQYVAKTVLNNLGHALKVRVDLIAMGGISILDGEGSQAAQIVGSTEVELAAGAQNVDVEIPYILQSEGDYTLSLVVTADDPEIELNPVMIEEPVDVEVVEPEMPSLEEWGLGEETATAIKTGETWHAFVYITAGENAVDNWVLVAKGGNVATSNEAVVNLEAGATGNYKLNITFDGTTENELGEDVFAYEMYLVNGLIEIPFLNGTVGFIPTYEYDITFEAPETVEADKAFSVKVNFDNKADRIRDWKANIYLGEEPIGSTAINVAAKTKAEVTVQDLLLKQVGEKELRIEVFNNDEEVVKTETFTVGVTMTSVAIATEVPATAAAGKEFEVKATITNDGTEAFDAYTVELLVNDVVVETKTSEEALAADANAEFTFTLTEEPETYNVAVRFTAGEYNKTSEVKPVVVEEVITVAFAAQFAESYEVGDIVATTLTVTNDSRVAVAGKLYTYAKSAETTENSPVAEAVEINLAPGASTEVSVEIKDLEEGTWDVYFILREGDFFSKVIAESGKYTINMVVTPTEVKVGDLVVKAESKVIAGEAWEATVEFANEGIALEGYKLAAYCDGVELASTEVAVAFRETFKHTFKIDFSEEAFGPQQVTFYLFNAEKEEVASQIADVTIVDPAPELAGTVVAAQPAEAYVYRTIEVPVTVTNNGDVTFDSYNVYLVVDNEALILTGVAGVEPLAAGESAVVYPFFRTDEEGIYNVKAVLIANGETIDTSEEIAIDVVNAPVVREPNVTATAEFDNEIYVGETLNVTVTLKNESLPVDFKLTAVGAEVAEATEIEGSLEEGAEETYGLAVKFTDEAYASVPFSVVVTVGNKVFETPLNVTIVDKPEEPRPSVEVPGLEIPVGYHGYAYWTPEEIADFQGAAGMNLNTEYLPTSFTVEGIAMGKALTSPTVSLQEGRSYLLAYFVDNRAAQNSSVKLTAWEGIEGLQIRNNAKDWEIVTVNYTAEEDKDVDVTLGFNLFSGAKATVYGLAVLESDDFVSPVIESEVNTNVAGATVRFTSEAGWDYTVETDAEGNATLDVNNNTVYNVVAMKSAYKDSESIVWTAGPVETETLSFELEENAVNELSLFVNDDNAPYNVVLSWDAVTPGSLDPTVEYRVYNNGVHVATVNQPAAAAEMRAAGVVSYDFVGLSKGSYTFGVAAYFPASETETTVAEISYDLVSTGISMIVNDNNVEAIYDLNGRRISKENVEAGMYVIRYANGETRRVMVTK